LAVEIDPPFDWEGALHVALRGWCRTHLDPVHPVDPAEDPVYSPEVPVDPPKDPVDPAVDPVDPPVDPVDPAVDPTVDLVDPVVHPIIDSPVDPSKRKRQGGVDWSDGGDEGEEGGGCRGAYQILRYGYPSEPIILEDLIIKTKA
jgi:hypothetical protein